MYVSDAFLFKGNGFNEERGAVQRYTACNHKNFISVYAQFVCGLGAQNAGGGMDSQRV